MHANNNSSVPMPWTSLQTVMLMVPSRTHSPDAYGLLCVNLKGCLCNQPFLQ